MIGHGLICTMITTHNIYITYFQITRPPPYPSYPHPPSIHPLRLVYAHMKPNPLITLTILCSVLTLLFAILKLFSLISWPWLLVTSPLWLHIGVASMLVVPFLILLYIYRDYKKKK